MASECAVNVSVLSLPVPPSPSKARPFLCISPEILQGPRGWALHCCERREQSGRLHIGRDILSRVSKDEKIAQWNLGGERISRAELSVSKGSLRYIDCTTDRRNHFVWFKFRI